MTLPRLIHFVLLVLLLTPQQLLAAFGSMCFEPTRPYCADSLGYSQSEYAFQSCRDEIERFSRNVNEYIQCKVDEAESEYKKQLSEIKIEAVAKRGEASRAIQRFNCYAKGGKFCP